MPKRLGIGPFDPPFPMRISTDWPILKIGDGDEGGSLIQLSIRSFATSNLGKPAHLQVPVYLQVRPMFANWKQCFNGHDCGYLYSRHIMMCVEITYVVKFYPAFHPPNMHFIKLKPDKLLNRSF